MNLPQENNALKVFKNAELEANYLKEEQTWDLLKNMKEGTPVIATSISNSNSSGRGYAKDNSVAFVNNGVRASEVADASGQDDSIATAISLGDTNLTTDADAQNYSGAVSTGSAGTNGKSTARAQQGSVALANNKNTNTSQNKVKALNSSLATGATTSNSGADSIANASQAAFADSKALDTANVMSDLNAQDNSKSNGKTNNNSVSTSRADSINGSKARTLAEGSATGKTNLNALTGSEAEGDLFVNSASDSNGAAINGGNAIATSNSKTSGDNTGSAENKSKVKLNNRSENKASALSNSQGTLQGTGATYTAQARGEGAVPTLAPEVATESVEIPTAAPTQPTLSKGRAILAQETPEAPQPEAPQEEVTQPETPQTEAPQQEAPQPEVPEQPEMPEQPEKAVSTGVSDEGDYEKAFEICKDEFGDIADIDNICDKMALKRKRRQLRRPKKLRQRRVALKQRRPVYVAIQKPVYLERPRVLRQTGEVDYEGSANTFVANNANSIKRNAQGNLKRIEDNFVNV